MTADVCGWSSSLRFRQAIEESFPTQIEFTIHQRRRSAEGIAQFVHRQRGVLTVVPDDHRDAVPPGHVNPSRGSDRRGEDEIVVKGSPQERKALAKKVFGSNLILDCKIARGSCVKPWSLLVETSQTGGVVRTAGLEPARLTALPPQSSASANSATCARSGP